jgi:hypothetical protein
MWETVQGLYSVEEPQGYPRESPVSVQLIPQLGSRALQIVRLFPCRSYRNYLTLSTWSLVFDYVDFSAHDARIVLEVARGNLQAAAEGMKK